MASIGMIWNLVTFMALGMWTQKKNQGMIQTRLSGRKK